MGYTNESTLKIEEMEKLWGTVTRATAFQPTEALPGSALKIVILSLRYEFGNGRFTEGIFLKEDYNAQC